MEQEQQKRKRDSLRAALATKLPDDCMVVFEDVDLNKLIDLRVTNLSILAIMPAEELGKHLPLGCVSVLEHHGLLATAAGVGEGRHNAAGAGTDLASVTFDRSASSIGKSSTEWSRHIYNPSSSAGSLTARLRYAAFFGFRPAASLPAVIPAQLVSPAFSHILQAVAQPAQPPSHLTRETFVRLHDAVQDLVVLGSRVHPDERQLQDAFLEWYNGRLAAGIITPASRGASNAHEGMHTVTVERKTFAVCVLQCKSDQCAGQPMMQAYRYIQQHYKDGQCWQSDAMYRCGPLPALVLLLEGPRLAIHAVWTIYQNRVGYAPLTPSYYLANEGPHVTANVWKLMAVLAAYVEAVQELTTHYRALAELDIIEQNRMAGLRVGAHTRTSGQDETGAQAAVPCTLPYCLLDAQLGLTDITFRGPGLLYAARQRLPDGPERHVLVKFVEGAYGKQVHLAWHKAGLAPELLSTQPVGGSGSLFTMVVMEHLRPDDGWRSLYDAVEQRKLGAVCVEELKAAVRKALEDAHAVPLAVDAAPARGAAKGVHGDMRLPNILVRIGSDGAIGGVRFIDFDWAGPDGVATYPPVRLSSIPQWHLEARAFATMRQAHDVFLLDSELEGI